MALENIEYSSMGRFVWHVTYLLKLESSSHHSL